MMVTLALGALMQAAALPPPDVVVEDEILVIARKLEQVSAWVSRDGKGRYACELSDSTGNRQLDRDLCRAATDCVREGARTSDQVKTCLDAEKPALLADVRRALVKPRS